MKFEPNAINIVPQTVSFTLDLRSVNGEALNKAQRNIDHFIAGVVEQKDLQHEREEMVRFAPVPFAVEMVDRIKSEAAHLGLTVREMPSGAGHDAQMLAAICPTAMIFVPSVKGISHNVEELSLDRDVENGANVLLNTVLGLAGRA